MQAMPPVHKFLFDTSFDQAPVQAPSSKPEAPPAPVEPPEPHFTEADLAAAREQGYAAGQTAAAAEAQMSIERATATALESIAHALGTLIQAQAEAGDSFVRAALETAVAIVQKLHPELARRHGLAEVEGLLGHCLETLRDEPRLVIRVEDGLLDRLGSQIEALTRSSGFEGRVILLADASIAPGDCRVEWADGGVERNSAALWEDIEAAIRRALADPPGPTPRPQDGPAPSGPVEATTPDSPAERQTEQA